MNQLPYHEQKDRENIRKLRSMIQELPPFCPEFFRGIEPQTSSRTRIAYAYDMKIFFDFLRKENPAMAELDRKDITLSHLDQLTVTDLEEYMEYLKYYKDDDGVIHTNNERGLHRKLAALRSFFHYYYKREMIKNDPTVIVVLPKLHKREIVRLDIDEVAELLDYVEHGGDEMTGMKKVYFNKNKTRNLALFTLLLGTGIRVSECVGLDLEDLDFKNNRIRIIRKGGKEDFVYFGDEVSEALYDYYAERKTIPAKEGHEHAFFLSVQKRRITVQAVENLVTDCAKHVTTIKHRTPHKLRST